MLAKSWRKQENYVPAIVISVLLHIGIAMLLVVSFNFSSPTPPIAGDVIEAVIVDSSVLDRREAEKQREVERKAAAEKAAQERRQAEQRKREAEAAERKAAEALRLEKQRKLEEQKKLDAQRKQEEARKAEEKRKQEEARLAEEKRKAEERRLLEAAQQRELAQLQADKEAAARRQAEQRELASVHDMYRLAIQQKVERNWIKPSATPAGSTCQVIIRQIPGGEVVDVKIESCEGDNAFRRSVEHAIYRASPLPEPPDPRVFDRDIRMTFTVSDNV